MFGVDNTGVINQRQSPAIWQSDIADFPANYILGRILIDTFQGGIYIDTASTRLQISNGSNTFSNGLQSYGGIPTNQIIGLGGDMNYNTQIDLNGNNLKIINSIAGTTFNATGTITDDNTGSIYLPAEDTNITVLVPDKILVFSNPETGDIYKVLCKKN